MRRWRLSYKALNLTPRVRAPKVALKFSYCVQCFNIKQLSKSCQMSSHGTKYENLRAALGAATRSVRLSALYDIGFCWSLSTLKYIKQSILKQTVIFEYWGSVIFSVYEHWEQFLPMKLPTRELLLVQYLCLTSASHV